MKTTVVNIIVHYNWSKQESANLAILEQKHDDGYRHAQIDVPIAKTIEEVQQQVDKFPDGTIYKITSNKLIYSNDDIWVLNNKDDTDNLVEKRHREQSQGDGTYIAYFWWNTHKADFRRQTFDDRFKVEKEL